jgi:hypothetical protein
VTGAPSSRGFAIRCFARKVDDQEGLNPSLSARIPTNNLEILGFSQEEISHPTLQPSKKWIWELGLFLEK